ncbi:G3E family GTPase [Oikeobacillus pervagus]|uniref:G3E family GTPase n=1 Tax=Oikeobacillus pervagus TaxID=1325931 RepID=A0AAJ1WIG9_9BACI|nr:GTP-binding protein [Oikeobacillus pervagus]MDQ0214413.1 G3E family GTPase [Oikeobacillus pervagus]
MNKKHVYVLSGFLGSGKTTLLKRMITFFQENGRRPAILMNELGEVSIDSNEVEEGTPLRELLNGCICCTIQGQLESQLQELLGTECFDDLIIETTGVAHPVEAIDAIMTPLFADQLEWKGIITVIDSLLWKRKGDLDIQLRQLLHEQVKHADLIILNKTDSLSEMERGIITYDVQDLNQIAQIFITNYSEIPMKRIAQLQMGEKKSIMKTTVNEHLHLSVYVHTFTKSVDKRQFENWLKKYVDHLYRMKGYIPFTHTTYPVLFQYSYGMPIYIPEDMNMPTNLVIIGDNLDKEIIENELKELEYSS